MQELSNIIKFVRFQSTILAKDEIESIEISESPKASVIDFDVRYTVRIKLKNGRFYDFEKCKMWEFERLSKELNLRSYFIKDKEMVKDAIGY